MYKQKLIALLEGLECQDIPELVEKSCKHLHRVGEEISKYAKIGAISDIASQQAVEADAEDDLDHCPRCSFWHSQMRYCRVCGRNVIFYRLTIW